MSKKRLLIYYPESMLKPVGGPAGYLFNLRQGLDTLNKEEFPIDVSFYEAAPKSLRDTVKNKDKIPKRLREFRRAVDDIFYEKKAYPLDEKLHQYDMIHFHSIDAMYLCRNVANMSLPQIGRDFGKRDHTTVMHACTKIEKDIKTNSNTKLIVESVKNIILDGK